jgi:NAD(P)-dependent dehydrogenase (short-subunit alcohol dehydrogenase family)
MQKKHFLIIGGTRGTGLVIARNFAKAGHFVSAIGRKAVSDAEETGIRYYFTDLTDTIKLKKTIAELLKDSGKVSNLIFCQRFRGVKNDWQGELETSLSATKNIIEFLADDFDNSMEKSIVIISSVVGTFVTSDQPLSYHVGKAGLNQMMRYYAVKLGPKGIRVNAVSPAVVLKEEARVFYQKNKKLADTYSKIIPLGRMGSSEDIYGTVSFLCSKESIYITGQEIIVDGGFSLLAQEGLVKELVISNKEIS